MAFGNETVMARVAVFAFVALLLLVPGGAPLSDAADAVNPSPSGEYVNGTAYWTLSPVNGKNVTFSANMGGFAYRHEPQGSESRGIRTLYVPTEEGVLYAINTGNYEVRWALDLGNVSLTTTPIAVNMDSSSFPNYLSERILVFVGTSDGTVHIIHDAWTNQAPDVSEQGKTFQGVLLKSVSVGNGSTILEDMYFDDMGTSDRGDDLLYVGATDGTVAALSMNCTDDDILGSVVWSGHFPASVDSFATLTSADDVLRTRGWFVGVGYQGVYGINPLSGENWAYFCEMVGVGPVILDPAKTVYFIAYDANYAAVFVGLDVETGELRYTMNETGEFFFKGLPEGLAVNQNDRELYASFVSFGVELRSSTILCLRSDLSVKWETGVEGVMGSPVYYKTHKRVYLADAYGGIVSLQTATGELFIRRSVLTDIGEVSTPPVIVQPIDPYFQEIISDAVFVQADMYSKGARICSIPALEGVDGFFITYDVGWQEVIDVFSIGDGYGFNITVNISEVVSPANAFGEFVFIDVTTPPGYSFWGVMKKVRGNIYYYNTTLESVYSPVPDIPAGNYSFTVGTFSVPSYRVTPITFSVPADNSLPPVIWDVFVGEDGKTCRVRAYVSDVDAFKVSASAVGPDGSEAEYPMAPLGPVSAYNGFAGYYVAEFPISGDGEYRVTVEARDWRNHTASEDVTFVSDEEGDGMCGMAAVLLVSLPVGLTAVVVLPFSKRRMFRKPPV